jgi:hypothetical protein
MEELASRFIKDKSLKAEVRSSTCEIGTREFNAELIQKGRSDKRFEAAISKVWKADYNSPLSEEQQIKAIFDRINFIPPTPRGRGALGEPLIYNAPCCCFNTLLLGNDMTPEGRNFNRHIEILIYTEEDVRAIADK